ncbi:MAG: hypothetical protein JNM21_13180 [Taibaiella sp.]|nr:hypothetical protein [Taibaiella sp.]
MKRFLKVLVLLCFAGSIFSCKKESTTFSYAWILNNSTVNVKLIPVKNSQLNAVESIIIRNNDSIKIITNDFAGKGKLKNPGFQNEVLLTADALLVIFNNTDSVIHYRDTSSPNMFPNINSVYQTNERGFMNIANWKWSYKDVSKHKLENYYKFIFTEEDYNFARQ